MVAEIRHVAAAVRWWLTADHTDTLEEPLDMREAHRRVVVREAEYQQWLEAQSRVLRVSGRPHRGRYPVRRLHAR